MGAMGHDIKQPALNYIPGAGPDHGSLALEYTLLVEMISHLN